MVDIHINEMYKCFRQNLTHRQIDTMLTLGFNIGCTLTRILKKDMF